MVLENERLLISTVTSNDAPENAIYRWGESGVVCLAVIQIYRKTILTRGADTDRNQTKQTMIPQKLLGTHITFFVVLHKRTHSILPAVNPGARTAVVVTALSSQIYFNLCAPGAALNFWFWNSVYLFDWYNFSYWFTVSIFFETSDVIFHFSSQNTKQTTKFRWELLSFCNSSVFANHPILSVCLFCALFWKVLLNPNLFPVPLISSLLSVIVNTK